jgi:hypothetical protein
MSSFLARLKPGNVPNAVNFMRLNIINVPLDIDGLVLMVELRNEGMKLMLSTALKEHEKEENDNDLSQDVASETCNETCSVVPSSVEDEYI